MVAGFVILLTNLPIAIYNSIHEKWMFGQEGEYKNNFIKQLCQP
jgi:hypothetical protein